MGTTPLPKYIARPMTEETRERYEEIFMDLPVAEMDEERYQSVFAKHIGAVAAPASSMHFSKNLLKRLEIRGVEAYTITSHVGLGNFKAVDVEDLTKHKVESEQIIITQPVVDAVNKAQEDSKRICAVGTTTMRVLESACATDGYLKEFEGWTNKFIFPPYDFNIPTAMVTNLHMPESTLLMLVAAFGGYELIMKAYDEALAGDYRFGAYGDAMLITD
jgi:S-adenosylmethionine:tRNA ribosyltransferase-isomerase